MTDTFWWCWVGYET